LAGSEIPLYVESIKPSFIKNGGDLVTSTIPFRLKQLKHYVFAEEQAKLIKLVAVLQQEFVEQPAEDRDGSDVWKKNITSGMSRPDYTLVLQHPLTPHTCACLN
jgi:hypothetical protein